MDDKSYVTMEQHVCLVCGKHYDTGALLLDKRLRKRFERHTLTGQGLCPEHQKLYDDGYVALIEIDPTKSKITGHAIHDPSDAYRTGKVAHIGRDALASVLNEPVTDKALCFVAPGLIDRLAKQAGVAMPEEPKEGK